MQERGVGGRGACAGIQIGKGKAEIKHMTERVTAKTAILHWSAVALPSNLLLAYAFARRSPVKGIWTVAWNREIMDKSVVKFFSVTQEGSNGNQEQHVYRHRRRI